MITPIPSLAKMGLKRATPKNIPDLITIYKSPYPVLSRYLILCEKLSLIPYGGGTHIHQGALQPGYITSGYRDDSDTSPHGFAVALDIAIGNTEGQIHAGRKALTIFKRVGLYPQNGIIHVDLFSAELRRYYGKPNFWVRIDGVYYHFEQYELACTFARDYERRRNNGNNGNN